jgi:hypothetical protein
LKGGWYRAFDSRDMHLLLRNDDCVAISHQPDEKPFDRQEPPDGASKQLLRSIAPTALLALQPSPLKQYRPNPFRPAQPPDCRPSAPLCHPRRPLIHISH